MNSNNHITKSSNNQSEETVLKVEGLSKTYRLGQIGTGTISHDLNRWWAKMRGKEDPFATVGVANDRSQKDGTNEYVKVLNDINFEVKKGEVLGIIGKNGAGKSTLLKVISQITSPTTGSVKAKGRIASLLEVGTGMHPEMTGKENVYLNGTILGMTRKEIDAKFDEIMDFAGCAKYADTPVKRYSSGMKVRLGFAVAAFLEPEILIVDEVLAVGDAEFQKKAIGKMQDISKGDGRTVLFVSHNMDSIQSLCTSAIVLENGVIKAVGEPGDMIEEYLRDDLNIIKEKHNLNDYKSREGFQNLTMIDLQLKQNTIKTGENLTGSVKVQNVCSEELLLTEFGISIWDMNQRRIISLSSQLTNQAIEKVDMSAIKSIEFTLNNLPIVDGLYQINFFVSSQFGIEDYVVDCGRFNVEDGDFFKTGKKVNPEWGMIAVKHKWKIY